MELEKKHRQRMIRGHSRRLNKLKETQALMGISTSPEILIEIEDIENELRHLEVGLGDFAAPRTSQQPDAPLVHVHNWGKRPVWPPEATVALDWQGAGRFEEDYGAGTRTVPSLEMWRDALLPRLQALPDETAPQGWVRLAGKCALSTGFALGTVFRAKERYQIEVAQFVPDKGATEYWASNAQPPAMVPSPTFTLHIAEGEGDAASAGRGMDEAVIVVAALTTKTVYDILEDVGTYFGEAAAFADIPDGNQAVERVGGVLVLEAQAATEDQRPLEAWEAAALARSSSQLVNGFKQRVKPGKLHLFMAAPLSLATFMGHHWTNIRQPVQCYEEVRTERVYGPSCLVEVR